MKAYDFKEYYNEEARAAISKANNFGRAHADEAEEFHRRALSGERYLPPTPTVREYTNAHLSGIFAIMTGKNDLNEANVTVEDVRNIADRFMIGGERYDIRGAAINEQNYMNVLSDISLSLTLGLSQSKFAPEIGLLDKDNNGITVGTDTFRPAPPEPVQEPKQPNGFKRFMNKHFGMFKNSFARYEGEVRNYDEYRSKLEQYNKNMTDYTRQCSKIDRMSGKLESDFAAEQKALNQVNTAENTRVLDDTVKQELNKLVRAVQDKGNTDKVKAVLETANDDIKNGDNAKVQAVLEAVSDEINKGNADKVKAVLAAVSDEMNKDFSMGGK